MVYDPYLNREQSEVFLLLENYVEDSTRTRQWLIELMLEMLRDIDGKSNDSSLITRFELSKRRGIIQDDIISKLMMFVEDLTIILEANHGFNGNYYQLLDKKDPDVGERIGIFMNSLDTFSKEDYKKMLCYVEPEELGISGSYVNIVNRLIDPNIKELQDFLHETRHFRKTHGQAFRRYKHAGLPIRTGLLSVNNGYPYIMKKFDSYAMIFAGEHPVNDVIPLPFSADVIEAYSRLMRGLQNFTLEAVENKMICLERRILGTIPTKNYSMASFSDQEENMLKDIYPMLNEKYPSWRKDDGTEIRVHKSKISPETIQWYMELDKFLEKSQKKKAVYEWNS